MRILFAGSPEIAVPSLKALSGMETAGETALAGILTNPDSRRGRSGNIEPTEVSEAAEALSSVRKEQGFPAIAQLKFEELNAQAREETASLKADLLVSFAYGRIFGPKFLSMFPGGGINIHPSLLPKYRGPTPIPAAILNRDNETGITIQSLAREMDAGSILAQERISLNGRETTASLSGIAAAKAAEMLPALIRSLLAGKVTAKPQTGEAVYCYLITKEQGLLDWKKSAVEIDAQIRAYTPWPLSFTRLGNETLYILEGAVFEKEFPSVSPPDKLPGTVIGIDRDHGILIQTGEGVYAVSRLQWQAKKALDWKAFYNGARNFSGSVLGR
ncbi:MAG: methionyl-tRNA formyltransferase [Treponema sp.]|jgi:methionyl-tRNA formyltransferase|nr:methionyl-tRNA formyltransferase [Treponema sp.]